MKKIFSVAIILTFLLTSIFWPVEKVKAEFSVTALTIGFNSLEWYERKTNVDTWYKLNLKAGESITVLEKSELTSGRLYVSVYDKNGSEVAKLRNKDDTYYAYMYNGQTGIADYTAPINGTYYIKV